MQFEEARDVLIMIDDLARTPRFRSAATLARAAQSLADLLPECPDGWVAAHTRGELRQGKAPSPVQLAQAWSAERGRRVDRVGRRHAPDGLGAGGPGRWARAYGDAVIGGASPDDAEHAADVALGVEHLRRGRAIAA